MVPHAWISTHSTAGIIVCGGPATVALLVKDYAVLQFANVVTTHAVDLRAAQLPYGLTLQVVDDLAVVKSSRRARFCVDSVFHIKSLVPPGSPAGGIVRDAQCIAEDPRP